ncbi:MAG TPA: hypothetical protein VL944_01000 [Candidatus Acidoferrum sp.]|nr:hypothetical protein [Candidatus Acidoferrum sp.]
MDSVYIPSERIALLRADKPGMKLLEKICHCKISIVDDEFVALEGKAYDVFVAKRVIMAFGRGFEMNVARLLLNEDSYFSSIDLKNELGSEKHVKRMKARIIGERGRAKLYIESVSSVKMCIYGDTVSFIGNMNEIKEAETAVNTLIQGGTHKLAYLRMEAAHRKNKAVAHNPVF